MSSIGSNRKESRPMESQKLPDSIDLQQSSSPLKSVAFSVRLFAKKMMNSRLGYLNQFENCCNN